MPSAPPARTWDARPTGWPRHKNSNAPVMARASRSPASTSRAPPRGRSNAGASASAKTARSSSIRARSSRRKWGSGIIRNRSSRSSHWSFGAGHSPIGEANDQGRMTSDQCRGPPSMAIRDTQVWKSIFRHPAPRDRRNRVVVMLTNVFVHLHPVSVRKSGIALSYTWCMGGITFFLFLVETVTGVLLMFYYRPTLEHAYNDILALRDVATLGVLRELHRWGAHAMVITIWLHMYRVFLTGSYKPPREFNWGVG